MLSPTWRLLVFSLIFALPATVVADESTQIQTLLVAELQKTIDVADGTKSRRFVPAAVVTQGEIVFYTVQVRNISTTSARDVVVTQRIPANTTYIVGSAAGPSADMTFSVDGGQTYLAEKDLPVGATPGAKRAPPQDYTHIRWQLRNALAPGAVALARFQAVFR